MEIIKECNVKIFSKSSGEDLVDFERRISEFTKTVEVVDIKMNVKFNNFFDEIICMVIYNKNSNKALPKFPDDRIEKYY